MVKVDPDYPRPQFRRERWIDLCGEWQFVHDDEDIGLSEQWFSKDEPFAGKIVVPFPPESKLSRVHNTGFHPILWYRREFIIDKAAGSGRLMLHFGAVDYRASVWINGRLACTHEGGHTPFSAEISPYLVSGEQQVITVRAEDDPCDLQQPRGKQYWEEKPGYIWYHRTTGIWQPVWLEPLPQLAIAEIRWTPDLDRFGVGLTVCLDRNPPPGWRLRIRLRGDRPAQLLLEDDCMLTEREFRRDLFLNISKAAVRRRRSLVWSAENPNLIDAELELVDGKGQLIDRVESYFGLRRIELSDGYFILNGIPTYLRLVLAQNYWPESHLAAPSSDALRREVELAKSLGFNGVRIHQKVEDPRFLYWCDQLGMLVWGEAANAYVYSERAAGMLMREWLEVLHRDYNHPCIVTWVPLNESWGVPDLDRSEQQRSFVRALYAMTRALDDTRPVIANDGWQHGVGDIFGIHDYSQDAGVLRERYADRSAIRRTFEDVRPHHHPLLGKGGKLQKQPIVISEYGGISYNLPESEDWFGYGQLNSPEELLKQYEALTGALLESTALAGFCYTQLTDTEQESNGLLTAEREPKLQPERIREINSKPSRAVQSEILDALIKQEVEIRRRKRGTEP